MNGWTTDAAAAQSENDRLAVEWFDQAMGRSLRQIAEDFRSYRISEAFKEAYRLFWDDFSGLYLETVKPAYGQPTDPRTMEATKGYFDALMRLLHPFMPFVTEEIWQALAPRAEGESICVAPMPEPCAERPETLARFELAKEVVSAVRNIRNQKNLPQKEALALHVIADGNYPAEYAPVMRKLANLSAIETVAEKDPAAAAFLVKTTQYFVPMEGRIDAEAERAKAAPRPRILRGIPRIGDEEALERALRAVGAREGRRQRTRQAGRCRGEDRGDPRTTGGARLKKTVRPEAPVSGWALRNGPRSGRGGMPRHKTQTAERPGNRRANGIRTARENLPAITIYTDGSALGNPGPGGYGAVLLAGPHRKGVVAGLPPDDQQPHGAHGRLRGARGAPVRRIGSGDLLRFEVRRGRRYEGVGLRLGEEGIRGKEESRPLAAVPAGIPASPRPFRLGQGGHAETVENNRCDFLAVAAANDAAHRIEDTGYEAEGR